MNRTRLHWALIAGSAAAIGVGAALGTRAVVQIVDATLPDARGIANFNRPGTITLLASNGQVIQKLGPATREKVKPGKMPLLVQQAFIAAEDRRFYDHDGIDAWGVARALVTNLKEGAVREGASTITQQLARTVFLSQDRTITRKLKEAALAMKLERQLSKQQILDQYLNYVYLGSSAYGVADAAWIYFSKQPDQLTVVEAALIAGLPPAPSVYSPLVNPELAKQYTFEDTVFFIVFLEDQAVGHSFSAGHTQVAWNKGGVIEMPYYCKHATSNAGFKNKMLVQCLGIKA